jgi:hypothetical protein
VDCCFESSINGGFHEKWGVSKWTFPPCVDDSWLETSMRAGFRLRYTAAPRRNCKRTSHKFVHPKNRPIPP